MRRVVFDTNVWQYLSVGADASRLDRELRRLDLSVSVPPATVVELGMNAAAATQKSALRLVAHHRWAGGRLEPEVLSECRELAWFIGSSCPDRLLDPPDLASQNTHLEYWMSGLYRDASTDPKALLFAGTLAERMTGRTSDAYAAVVKSIKPNVRKRALIAELRGDVQVVLEPPAPPTHLHGYAVHPFAAWLLGQMYPILVAVTSPRVSPAMKTWKDWLGCFLDLRALANEIEDVATGLASVTPRPELTVSWLRWATMLGQTVFKVGHGSAGDNQLCLYLPRVDMVVTADRGLADLIEMIRPFAPAELPAVIRVLAPNRGASNDYGPMVVRAIVQHLAETTTA